jgi:hypothetical protein
MDPRYHPTDVLDGADCAACGRSVPAARVRLLASRQELAFAEVPCESCGTVSLAIFIGSSVPSWVSPERVSADTTGVRTPPPIDTDDLLDMHRFLARWTGDLRSLLGGGGSDRAAGAP